MVFFCWLAKNLRPLLVSKKIKHFKHTKALENNGFLGLFVYNFLAILSVAAIFLAVDFTLS
jgi:hypothetical protein